MPMKVTFLMVGKSSFPFVREGMEMYEKRISRYLSYERIEIPDLSGTSSFTKEQVKEREADLILKKLKKTDEVILLDERGSRYTSVKWAAFIEQKINTGCKSLVFIIGGAYGFSARIYERASSCLSLSDMTFSHQIIRLFFTEQLYRAMTIIKGEPYHNE